ncbi:B3 domain-containing protein REM16 isoform X2 [Spinacia oleracea]|uniref:B3 domain-containing protein REM16 isoform X2 n=1 Tax=Spinacia oleracea TaxID=3562 RepID=A0ABM3QIN3_SPIOL|nr:B3 domain-containing protein REM16-like isoform X2 [Spinacia oleracea]
MLGGEGSNNARTREENMYWRSFTPFFKVNLHADFRSGVEIPLYFSENVKKKLPQKVALKGPGVDFDTWEVQLKMHNNATWVVGEGWEDFAAAFSLEENDTLVFKYKNNSYFKVRIFSGKTSCERESSHFVIKSVSQQTKESRSKVEKPCTVKKQETEIGLAISGSEREKKINDDQESILRESVEKTVLIEVDDDSDDDAPTSTRIFKRKVDSGICNKSSKETKLAFQRAVKPKIEGEYISPLRGPPECNQEKEREIQRASQRLKEIRKTWQQAKETQRFTEKSFCVSLSRTHVSGKTVKLGIPKQWWTEVIKSKGSPTHLRLRVKGNDEYDPRLYGCRYDNSNCSGRITTGWKKFVEDNSLCQHDCCVFSLAEPFEDNNEIVYLEVEIIRVITLYEDSD